MFAVQVPALLKTGWRHSWGLGLEDPALRRMLWLAVPTVIYVVTNLVAVSFRNASAFAVSPTGPSILTYAWIFYQLPYGILAVALATAVFTELADAAGRQDTEEFKSTFLRGLRTTGVLMLPTSALLIALATPLVSLYRVGAFKASDVPLVVGALRWWACGLIFYASTMFLLRTFYSLKDTRTPMLVNIALTVVQIGLYVVLSTGIGAWPGLGINGMPIADVVFFTLSSIHARDTPAPAYRRLRPAWGRVGVRPHAPGLRRRGRCGMGDRARARAGRRGRRGLARSDRRGRVRRAGARHHPRPAPRGTRGIRGDRRIQASRRPIPHQGR